MQKDSRPASIAHAALDDAHVPGQYRRGSRIRAGPSRLRGWRLDEALSVTSETTGVAPKIVAVDRLDRLVESGDAGVRWIDAHGTPLSSFFGATAEGAFPLIGGGLLTTDDRMIPSGDSQAQPAPDWLRGRAGSAFVVLSGRAYAFTDASCAARIYSAGGEFCGTLSFPGCSAPPRFGADDSAIVSLSGGGWGLWIRLLQ